MFDADGEHVGYFEGAIAYSRRGRPVGEVYGDDWVGWCQATDYPAGVPRGRRARISRAKLEARKPVVVAGWQDPKF